jgi:hypothetical protein
MILDSVALQGALLLLLCKLSIPTNLLSYSISRLLEIEPTVGDNAGSLRTR